MEQVQAQPLCDKKSSPTNSKGVTSNVFTKSVFDTKNYYYYFTELRKDQIVSK